MAHFLATSSASGAGAAGVGVLNGLSSLVGSGEVVVADGAMVIETVRQVHADLVILDFNLPGLTGIEVYDRMRADETIRDMPVLFVSAIGDRPDLVAELERRSITHIVRKPFDLNQLLDRVRTLCPPAPSGG